MKKKEHFGRENNPYSRNGISFIVTKPCLGCNGNEICLIRAEFFLG